MTAEHRVYTLADLHEIDYGMAIRELRPEWVRHLADTLSGGEVFAADYPIVLYEVEGHSRPYLTDGFHRLAAFQLSEHPMATNHPPGTPRPRAIRAVFRRGTYDEALEHSAVANAQHGRRLDKYDRPASILRLASLGKTHREIARLLGMDPTQRSSVQYVIEKAAEIGARTSRRRSGRKRPPAVTTLDHLLRLTRPLNREKPEAWAEAVVAEHLREYEARGEPPDLGPVIDRLRLLLVLLNNRRKSLPEYSLHVPSDG